MCSTPPISMKAYVQFILVRFICAIKEMMVTATFNNYVAYIAFDDHPIPIHLPFQSHTVTRRINFHQEIYFD